MTDAAAVIEVVNGDSLDSIIGRGELTLVCFHAPAWCVPCRAFEPHYQRAAKLNTNVTFVSIDVDLAPDLAQKYEIQSVPTVYAFRNSVRVADAHARTVLALDREIKTF